MAKLLIGILIVFLTPTIKAQHYQMIWGDTLKMDPLPSCYGIGDYIPKSDKSGTYYIYFAEDTTQVKRKFSVKRGHKHGTEFYWNINNVLILERNYDKRGRLDGTYKTWDEKGNLVMDEVYAQGVWVRGVDSKEITDTIPNGIFRPTILDYVYQGNPSTYPGSSILLPAYDQSIHYPVGKIYLEFHKGRKVSNAKFVPSHSPNKIYQFPMRCAINEFYTTDVKLLVWYREQDGYLNILNKTTPGGFWIKKKDLQSVFEGLRFQDFLLLHEASQITGYDKVRLYASPKKNGKRSLLKLKIHKHKISHFTGKTYDTWGEVVVHKIDPTELTVTCFTKELLNKLSKKTWKGWIRIAKEDGSMNSISIQQCTN